MQWIKVIMQNILAIRECNICAFGVNSVRCILAATHLMRKPLEARFCQTRNTNWTLSKNLDQRRSSPEGLVTR